jgi:hypothetical protein
VVEEPFPVVRRITAAFEHRFRELGSALTSARGILS